MQDITLSHPSLIKIRALPPYEIYAFGTSKTWATLYNSLRTNLPKSLILGVCRTVAPTVSSQKMHFIDSRARPKIEKLGLK